ncbi:MAG: LysE family translocator [Synergistales bacterium]
MPPELVFFVKGIFLGFSIAAPVGPIGVLCIRRTLESGMLNGFLSGLGAATADGIYGCLAAFGVTVISNLLLERQSLIRLVGGLFLLYLGRVTFKAVPAAMKTGEGRRGLLSDYISVFFLTVTNPMTILSFGAVFAGLGIGSTRGNPALAGLMVLGVVSGSALWWLVLSGTVNLFRTRFNHRQLRWVNRFSGFIICCFGMASLGSLLNRL